MATKPITSFAWATGTNYASGPATGLPIKVALPDTVNALVPGDDLIPEYLNNVLNLLSSYTDWIFAGSSTGAADAHPLETDSNGDTAVQVLACVDVNASGEVTAMAGVAEEFRVLAAQSTITFEAVAGPSLIRKSRVSGNGATDGEALAITGQDGQNQTGGADNNDGGPLVITGGQRGAGGSGAVGGHGWVQLQGDFANTNTWLASVGGSLPSGGTLDVLLAKNLLARQAATLIVTWNASLSAQSAVAHAQTAFRIVTNGSALTAATTIATIYSFSNYGTGAPTLAVIAATERIHLRWTDNEAAISVVSAKLELVVGDDFP